MYKPSNTGGFSCEKCGSTTIFLSCSPIDHRGTLSCLMCGGTEDSAIGILKHGKRVTTFIRPDIMDYLFNKKRKYDSERGYHDAE